MIPLLSLIAVVLGTDGSPESGIIVRDPVRDSFCVEARKRAVEAGRFSPAVDGAVYGRSFDVEGKPISAHVLACAGDDCVETWSSWLSDDGFFFARLVATRNSVQADHEGYEGASIALGQGEFCLEVRLQSKKQPPWVVERVLSKGAPTEEILAFSGAMTRPRVPSDAFRRLFSREARAEAMIVRCRVHADGRLDDCHAIKGLPELQGQVLRRLASVRATPATLDGHPVSVDYVFSFQFPARDDREK